MDKRNIGNAMALPSLSVLCGCFKPLEVSTCGVDATIETAPDNEIRRAVTGEIVRGDGDMPAALIGSQGVASNRVPRTKR